MSAKVRVEMKPVGAILARLGVDKNGRVQRFLTETVDKRITQYMPFRAGVLATKLKFVSSPTEITVNGPYARYQYYGKVMVGKPPKQVTDTDLVYDRTKHPNAGPFWDRRMMAAEKDAIVREVQAYVKRGGKT